MSKNTYRRIYIFLQNLNHQINSNCNYIIFCKNDKIIRIVESFKDKCYYDSRINELNNFLKTVFELCPFCFCLEIDKALVLMTIVAFQFREIHKKKEQKWLFQKRRKAEERDYYPWEISRHYLCEFYPDSFQKIPLPDWTRGRR